MTITATRSPRQPAVARAYVVPVVREVRAQPDVSGPGARHRAG